MEEPPPYPIIRSKLFAGRVIPFLGAGTSTGVRTGEVAWSKGSRSLLPRASELAEHLATASELAPDVPRDLPAIAYYYESRAGRALLYEELHDIFTGGNQPLRPIHRLLADVDKPLLIVTTNYDDLMERALRERNRPFATSCR
jgi:hypothetical protein